MIVLWNSGSFQIFKMYQLYMEDMKLIKMLQFSPTLMDRAAEKSPTVKVTQVSEEKYVFPLHNL